MTNAGMSDQQAAMMAMTHRSMRLNDAFSMPAIHDSATIATWHAAYTSRINAVAPAPP